MGRDASWILAWGSVPRRRRVPRPMTSMTHRIDSLFDQLREVFPLIVETGRKARSGPEAFYRAPLEEPRPLPLALLRSALQALGVGLLRGRSVTWLGSSGFSRIPDPCPAPALASSTERRFKRFYVLRKLGVPARWLNAGHRRWCAEAERAVAHVEPAAPRPLDELDAREASDEEIAAFLARHVETCTPCVLRGHAAETTAARTWSVDWFVREHGATRVPVSRSDREEFGGTLAELDEATSYLQNCDSVFAACPELLEHLQMDRLERLLPGLIYVHPQLFLGRDGLGSPFHCAPVWNLFHLFEGRKRWTFVHPGHIAFMYPQVVPWIYTPITSHVGFGDEDDLRRCPLYERCPRYEVTLEPGDVLLNPPWWWHSVRNSPGPSCAVATRWIEPGTSAEKRICASIRPDIQTLFSWEAAVGMSVPLLTYFGATGFGMVKPEPGKMTVPESITRYHRPSPPGCLL